MALAACSQKPQEPAIEAPEGYELVWHDEFNEGTTLSADWIHEVKPSGWVNQELKNYVDGEHHGKRVTEISDGTLKIHCFQEGDSIFITAGTGKYTVEGKCKAVLTKIGK